MAKLFFQIKSNSPVDRIGQFSHKIVWTDTCATKKEVRERYSSKTSKGYKVVAVFTEEQFIEKYGASKAAQTEKYYLA